MFYTKIANLSQPKCQLLTVGC